MITIEKIQALKQYADSTSEDYADGVRDTVDRAVAILQKNRFTKLDKECQMLHECITELYDLHDDNGPVIRKHLDQIKNTLK